MMFASQWDPEIVRVEGRTGMAKARGVMVTDAQRALLQFAHGGRKI